jgi:hypothetical protein
MSMKNSNDIIGNRTRDLPTCNIVPQPTAPPHAPKDTYITNHFHLKQLIKIPWIKQSDCKVKIHPCTGTEALYRPYGPYGGRGIALLFHDHGTSITPRPLFTTRKNPVPIVQEAGWVSGTVWTGAENLAPNRIRSPDRPARSQSLYRLSYPAHSLTVLDNNSMFINSVWYF